MRHVKVLGLVALGVLVGGVGVWPLAQRASRDSTASVDLARITLGIDSLKADLESMRSRLDVVAAVPSPTRSEVGGGSDAGSIQDLMKSIAELRTRLDTVVELVSEVVVPELLTPPQDPIPQNKAAVTLIRDESRLELKRVAERHFCWTRLQVYRAYGIPDGVMRSGQTLVWQYYPDSSRDGVAFSFEDGLVTSVYPWTSPNPR